MSELWRLLLKHMVSGTRQRLWFGMSYSTSLESEAWKHSCYHIYRLAFVGHET